MSIYYNKGKKAKELLNIYNNRYPKGTYEHNEWKRGFKDGVYEPIDYNVELEDCSDMFDKYIPISIIPKSIK